MGSAFLQPKVIDNETLDFSPDDIVTLPEEGSEEQLGSGVITGYLGNGGMAVVYEIWNEELGIHRAVKLLRPYSSQENRDRFDTEIKVMAQLDHPNIVKIHSTGTWKGLPYLEMERVDGYALNQLRLKYGSLPVEVCVSIALIVSRALLSTHSLQFVINPQTNQRINGIVHRDIKPENILVARNGKVSITDFGASTPLNVSNKTPDGNIIGSLQYAGPEQIRGEMVDFRTDIFSFGCVLYEMLTGHKPFPVTNLNKLVQARMHNSFTPLSSFSVQIPERLKRLIERCMRYAPADRFGGMKEIVLELSSILGSLTETSAEKVIAEFMAEQKSYYQPVYYKEPIRYTTLIKRFLPIAATVIVLVGSLFWFLKDVGKDNHSPTPPGNKPDTYDTVPNFAPLSMSMEHFKNTRVADTKKFSAVKRPL